VAERGDWFQEVFWKAEKAWSDGDEYTALLGFLMMAERGYEVAQNNVAYILDRHKKRLRLPKERDSGGAADRLALTYWTRSAAQDNIDALVKMGDYYLDGFGTSSGQPQPDKAAACYQTATNTHLSAMAMWNLGWMHENGIGVSQDYHLAKRFYDLALETNSEASLPVTLALVRLYIRSVWDYVVHGDSKYLLVFTSASDEHNGSGWWSLRRLRDELTRRWLGISPPPGANQGEEREVNNAGDREGGTFDAAATQKALDQDEDPLEWARNARERDRMLGEGEEEDDVFLAGTSGDDFLETVGILFLCLGLGLVPIFLSTQDELTLPAANTYLIYTALSCSSVSKENKAIFEQKLNRRKLSWTMHQKN
jgi:SEL1 protein